MADPKVGYHWIWMVPLATILLVIDWVKTKVSTFIHKQKMKKLLKNNPELKELTKLSGIEENGRM